VESRVNRVALNFERLQIDEHTLPLKTSKMATTTQVRLRGRPAHTAGPTYCSYTPDGTKLVTVGSNNTLRVFNTGSDGEPMNIDEVPENNQGLDSTVSMRV